jgi:hypothetical protein
MSLLEKFQQSFEKNFYEAADTFGYREAKGIRKKEIKSYALEETLKELPEIKPLLEVRGAWHPNKGEKPTPEQLEGQKFYSRIGVVVLKYMKNGRYMSEKNTKDNSIKERFEEACRMGFVPETDIAAVLLGCHPTYPMKLMRESELFSFKRIGNGYQVTEKEDLKKKKRISELETQMEQMMKELQELKK